MGREEGRDGGRERHRCPAAGANVSINSSWTGQNVVMRGQVAYGATLLGGCVCKEFIHKHRCFFLFYGRLYPDNQTITSNG